MFSALPPLLFTIPYLTQANLEIYKEFKQNKFPAELFDVHMFALRPRDLARSDQGELVRPLHSISREEEAKKKLVEMGAAPSGES